MKLIQDLKATKLLLVILMTLVANYIFVSYFDMDMFIASYAALAGMMIAFFYAIFLVSRERKITRYEFLVFLFLIFLTFVTILNGINFRNGIYAFFVIFAYIVLFTYYRSHYQSLVLSVAVFLSLALYCQFYQCVIHPELWLNEDDKEIHGFLLGGNYNQMGSRLILVLVLNVLSVKYSKWLLINTITSFVSAFIVLLMVRSMTALSSIFLFTVICLLRSKHLIKLIIISIFACVILFQCLVCFSGSGLENNEFVTWLVTDILKKDMTFTGRTFMWDAALHVIENSPVWGYGMVDTDWYLSNMETRAIGAHNYILNMLIFGGGIGLALYLFIVGRSILNLINADDRNACLLLAAFAVMCIMMLFETYETQIVFMLLAFMYYYPQDKISRKDVNHA